MPVAKLRASGTPKVMKADEGNDSLDTIIRQSIAKELLLSFSRPGDSPVQWIQLLNPIDPQDLPGWPFLTPLKIQMQKCGKCSREFCSLINYRRHMRVHRRSLNVHKESHKNRDLLGAFWDKLSEDEVKEIVSFKDVTLEDVPGSSIVRTLTSFIREPGFYLLPQVYVRAGSALLDIIQARPSRLPISSQELFGILDDASERTFLCAGTAESLQRYVFDGEASKIGLEMKNLVACTSFIVEQKLVKAWLADKDAEALRCQKLLVEEEEAAQRRQAMLLERKRQKMLCQKEQKVKEQSNAENTDSNITLEIPPLTETSSTPIQPESNSQVLDNESQFSNVEGDNDNEVWIGFGQKKSRTVPENGHRHLVSTHWQVPKRGGRNGFHNSQNQVLKPGPMQKHGPPSEARAALGNSSKIWTRKPKAENDEENLRARLFSETKNQTDQSKCEVMIGSITVTVRNHTIQQQCNGLAEDHTGHGMEHAVTNKNNVQEKLTRAESIQSGSNRSTAKLWRPVNLQEAQDQLPVPSTNYECTGNLISEKGDRIFPSEGCLRSSAMDGGDSEMENNHWPILEEYVQPEGLPFSSRVAKAFLAQRWKEAISADHVKLVLSPEPGPSGCPRASDCLECSILDNAQNQLAGTVKSAPIRNAKSKSRTKPEKVHKTQYIPKQKIVT